MRHRTEKPLVLEFKFRLTPVLPEFKFRFHALVPLATDDQKFVFVPPLLNDPSVFLLPVRTPLNDA